MSDKLTMSLDDAISKSKGGRKGGDGKKNGGGKPFGRRRDQKGGRGGRGGRRFGRDRPNRDREGGFRGGRDRERGYRGGRDRERSSRGFREGREKREGDRRSGGPAKVALARRFIKRTGAPRTRPNGGVENVVRQSERPISERRRLRVSNLDFNITHKDLMELFSKLGTVTKNKIDYDDLGRSKGTALIEYEKHEGAIKAMKEYDGAVLDGKTISVEFDDDVKAKTGSNLVRKVITKEPRERRRFEDRDRRDRNRDRDRGFRRDRSYRGDRDRGFRGDRNRRFRSDRRD